MSRQVTRAGIIAAGRGDRLRSAMSRPKPLVPIAGRTLIERVLTSLAETSPAEVVIIVNEMSMAVKEHVEAGRWPFRIRWIIETTPSSMHSFLRVLETLAEDDQEGPFLMSTVDTVAPAGAYRSFLAASAVGDCDVALALTRSYDDDKPLLVRMDERTSRIEALGDDAERNTSVAGGLWATAGYYAVRAAVAREAAHARSLNLPALRSFFTHLLKNGYRLNGVPIAGAVDVDRPDDVKAAEAFLKQVGI